MKYRILNKNDYGITHFSVIEMSKKFQIFGHWTFVSSQFSFHTIIKIYDNHNFTSYTKRRTNRFAVLLFISVFP